MLRLLVLLLALALPAHASRYVTERAGGPVQWQAWGKDALELARKGRRPIFLSAGFVASNDVERMHREAFLFGENVEALNAYFVPVLLDAVAHPELAEAAELIARSLISQYRGASGTPVHLVLTPALEPIAAAGYLSSSELNRMLVIQANRWAKEREAVVAEARTNLTRAHALAERRVPGEVDMQKVIDAIAARYEQEKTLDPGTVSFLFHYAARAKHEPLRTLAVTILREQAATRLRDQLGGGFHHCDGCFEKTLPDQTRNAMAYLQAWQLTKDPNLAYVVRTTLDYVLRDLKQPEGDAFQASQDAHSLVPLQGAEHVNGAFYAWTREEVTRLLGNEDAAKVWPALEDPATFFASHDELAPMLQKLLDVRQKRPAPFRETTIVAGWNGGMISALARAASALNVPEYLQAATHAANQTIAKQWNAKKKTLARTNEGAEALAEDYALLVQGLLDLYDAGGDVKQLELALALQQRQDELFWDASAGRYARGKSLPAAWRGLVWPRLSVGADRLKVCPTTIDADAVAATNLLRIAALTGNDALRERASMIFQASGGAMSPALASAYELSLIAPRITVVTGDPRKLETYELLRTHRERSGAMQAVVFVPHKGPPRDRVTRVLPFTGPLAPDEKLPIAYECTGGTCVRR